MRDRLPQDGDALSLLLVRHPQRPRRPGVADEAGEDDDGEHVGDDLDELDGDLCETPCIWIDSASAKPKRRQASL